MKLSDVSLQEIYTNFPLLQEIFVHRFKISHSEFFALSSLRPLEMSSKVQEALLWISSSVQYIPPADVLADIFPPGGIESINQD